MSVAKKKNQASILDFFGRKRSVEEEVGSPLKRPAVDVSGSPFKSTATNAPVAVTEEKKTEVIEKLPTAEVIVIDDEVLVNGLDEDLDFLDIIFEETKENRTLTSQGSSSIDSGLGLGLVSPTKLTTQSSQPSTSSTKTTTETSVEKDFVFTTFHSIVQGIMGDDHFTHLFDDDDWNILHDLTCLPGPAQLMYLKIYTRNHSWIRMHTIRSAETVTDRQFNEFVELLLKHNLVHNSTHLETVEEALKLMSVPEMKKFVAEYKGFKWEKAKKGGVITSFVEYAKGTKAAFGGETIEPQVLERLRSWFKLKCLRINEKRSQFLDRIFLLYYNPYYLLGKLDKKHSYQWYRSVFYDFDQVSSVYAFASTNKVASIYGSWQHFTDFSLAFNLTAQVIIEVAERRYEGVVQVLQPLVLAGLLEAMGRYSESDQKLDIHLRPFTAAGMYTRALHDCLTALERTKRYQEYIDLVQNTLLSQQMYGGKYRAHWYKRATLISQTHLKQLEVAKALCLQGLEDDHLTAGNRLEIYQRLVKMLSSKEAANTYEHLCPLAAAINYPEVTIESNYCTIENDSKMKNFFVVNFEDEEDVGTNEATGDSLISVENVVILHNRKLGYSHGMHCESSIYVTMFGLIMWDIIYDVDNVADTFRYHKQLCSLDLNYSSFFERRRDTIEARLEELAKWDADTLQAELKQSWTRNFGKVSLIVWQEGEEYLQQLLVSICLLETFFSFVYILLFFSSPRKLPPASRPPA